VLGHLSIREGPLGCVATVHTARRYELDTLKLSRSPLLVIAEGIEKPGNLVVLIRSASAAGADAFITVDSQTDVFEPGCVHASLGSVFTTQVVQTTSGACTAWLATQGIEVLSTTPAGRHAYFEQDMTGPVAIAVGNEHRGLSDQWLETGTPVRIDMVGPMNSLNASVAGAVLMFEAVRQRTVASAARGPAS
jgi:RNA methyltransferase, TrmH family